MTKPAPGFEDTFLARLALWCLLVVRSFTLLQRRAANRSCGHLRALLSTGARACTGYQVLSASASVAVLAFSLRWWRHDVNFDVFVDEFVYQGLGHSVRDGGLPRFGQDELFFLHPPGFFYLLGAWERLTGADASTPMAAVFQARVLNALLAGLTAALLVWLVGRRSLRWGLLAGLVFAVEPFALRQNGRVLLETAAVAWVLVGLAILIPLTEGRHRAWRAVLGGLALGCAVLTKDMLVMLTLLPLAVAWAMRPRERSWVRLAFPAALVPYGAYLAFVAATGHLGAWFETKGGGLLRVLGVEVTTGFSAPGAPSLWVQIRSQLLDFAPTYLLLGAGVLCAFWLLSGAAADMALIALTHLGALTLLGYSATAGTIEEHFLYFLLVPSVLVVAGAGARLQSGELGPPRRRRNSPVTSHARPSRSARFLAQSRKLLFRYGAVLLACLMLLIIVLDTMTYVRWAQRTDDGYTRAREYLMARAVPGTGVIVVNGTSEFALGDAFNVGPFTSDEDRIRHDVRYLVVPWKEVIQGYTYVTLDTVQELAADGRRVLTLDSPTYGSVDVYLLPPPPVSR